MNFDDMASAHMLKDYSVFWFVPRFTFRNETKGYVIWNWFVRCVQTFNRYIEMAISKRKV